MAKDFPPPMTLATNVNLYLDQLAQAFKDGDTNPHIVLYRIMGEVYAEGWHHGYVAHLQARPLEPRSRDEQERPS